MSVPPTQFLDPESLARTLRTLVAEPLQEELWVIALDTRNHALGSRMISRGTADRCTAHPRDIFRFLLQVGPCTKFVVGHNHPSGDVSPSPADLAMTRQLTSAAETMGITLLDHVIVSSAPWSAGRYCSLRETHPETLRA